MVQIKTIDRLAEQTKEIAREAKTKPEVAKRVMEAIKNRINNNRRHPREPIPEGGISIREAARKYKIDPSTITLWHQSGKIKILKKTLNWLYIDEKSLLNLIKKKLREKSIPGKKLNCVLPIDTNSNMSKLM